MEHTTKHARLGHKDAPGIGQQNDGSAFSSVPQDISISMDRSDRVAVPGKITTLPDVATTTEQFADSLSVVEQAWEESYQKQEEIIRQDGYGRHRTIHNYLNTERSTFDCLPPIDGMDLDEWLVNVISEKVHGQKPGSPLDIDILDVGCGEAIAIHQIKEVVMRKARTTIPDIGERLAISSAGIDALISQDAKTKLDMWREGNIRTASGFFPEQKFDAIISSAVDYHLPEVITPLRDQSKLLKKGGIIAHASLSIAPFKKSPTGQFALYRSQTGETLPLSRVMQILQQKNEGKYDIRYTQDETFGSSGLLPTESGKLVIKKQTDDPVPLDISSVRYAGATKDREGKWRIFFRIFE